MKQNVVCILITIIAYLAFMIIVGVVCSRKNKNVGDFYLGGRKLGPFVTAMSAEASDMSSYLLMGLPGLAYLSGMAEVGWTVIGLAVGTYLNWLIVAKKLRIYSSVNKSITIPEFFANRYGDKKHIISCISAVIILVFFVPYTASGFAACGKLFQSLFGMNYHIAMIISALVIISYTSIGGFLAASTTDFIQSIIMTVALLIMIIFGVYTAGGIGNIIDNAESLKGYFSLFTAHHNDTNTSSPYGFLSIISTVAWGLGYFGMPHILLRFMATESESKIKLSRRIASIWVVISMAVAILIGMTGRTLSASGVIENLSTSSDSETIIVKMAELLSQHGVIAALFAGLIFAGILACTMSTSDSQLLVASSSMSEDILKNVFKINLSEKASMLVARIVLLVISAISIIIAWNPNNSVFQIVSFAWAGFGATFGPLMLTSLFWKRSNKYGAIAGLLAGGLTIFIWKFFVRPLGGAWDIYELLPAFIVALLFIIVVSLATKAPEKEITDEFEKVKAMK
ncbi:MAG: sodium/proline symporter PutP [Ruminococcus callidus]|nr:sodium/proline symporter PutP [Ruminococcus callidus]